MNEKLLLVLVAGIAAGFPALSWAQTGPQNGPSPTYSQNAQANALFLKAREYLAKSDPRTGGTFANGREAIKLYREAEKDDPKFGLAYVEEARAWLSLSYSNADAAPDSETMPPMRLALHKAVTVAPDLADAHRMIAVVAYNLDYDWDTADREYKRSLELAPDNASLHTSYADFLSAMGRFPEALEQVAKAEALGPTALTDFVHARIYYGMHRYETAIEYCNKSLAKQDNLATRFYLALMYAAENRYDLAIPEFEATTKEKNGGAVAGLAYAYAMAGEKDRALALLDQLYTNRNSGQIVAYRIAAVYLALGDKPQALEWLAISYTHHDNWTAQLKVDPVMDPLRSDPEFQALMHKMRLG